MLLNRGFRRAASRAELWKGAAWLWLRLRLHVGRGCCDAATPAAAAAAAVVGLTVVATSRLDSRHCNGRATLIASLTSATRLFRG